MAWEGPGFVDHHTHLLRVVAGDRPPYDLADPDSIAAYHRSVASRRSTPMDEPRPPVGAADLDGAFFTGLDNARRLGLVEVTEAGLGDYAHLDALRRLRDEDRLPIRVRVLVASGLADPKTMVRLDDPALDMIGVKFYADGWLGCRTCAMAAPFEDVPDDGVLFLDALTLARRAEPFATRGWTIATHAIGDRAVEAVLDAYENIYGDDCPSAAPRIEHAQVLQPHLVERMAELGVVACIQPSFAVTDARTARAALGRRFDHAYRWDVLLEAGVKVITGADYPIEDLSPLSGLRDLSQVLPVDTALDLMTDSNAGTVVLAQDPREVDAKELPQLEVLEAFPALRP